MATTYGMDALWKHLLQKDENEYKIAQEKVKQLQITLRDEADKKWKETQVLKATYNEILERRKASLLKKEEEITDLYGLSMEYVTQNATDLSSNLIGRDQKELQEIIKAIEIIEGKQTQLKDE